MDMDTLVARIKAAPAAGRRRLVALAGPPASGKSTIAEDLARRLGGQVVPMDGFHLDNRILRSRGLLERKGAPETFDAAGFVAIIRRLQAEPEVVHPVFDRGQDIAIAGSAWVGPDCATVVVEGNYLLHDAPVWRDLAGLWDTAIRLDVPQDVLRARLVERWLDHGLVKEDAIQRAEGNDLRNARMMVASQLPADITIQNI